MLSIRTQTAIAVLQDLSFDTVLQTANFLLSEGEWKDLFDKLEVVSLVIQPILLRQYQSNHPYYC